MHGDPQKHAAIAPLRTAFVLPPDPPGLNNFTQVPIGSLYAAAQLQRDGFDASVHDLRIDPPTSEDYAELATADLVVVCSADYELAQCYPSLAPAAACIEQLRAAGAQRIACVGSHATVDSGRALAYTGADCAVIGEFEFAVPDLVRYLAARNELPLVWPLDHQARQGSVDELRALPSPAYHLAPMIEYASEGFVDGELTRVRSGLVLANRGCPFACNFCYLFFGRRVRRRPVEATLAEIQELRGEYGIRHFFFLDYTFTLDRRWVAELCDGLQRAHLTDVSWVCQTRVDCLDDATLARMRDAGCSGVWLGVESPELEQRRYLDKGRIDFAEITSAIEAIRANGLAALTFVMVGLPNETESSLASLNAWLDDAQPFYSLSTFQRRLGTPLATEEPVEAATELGWAYLDRPSPYLGESQLRRDELGWFFDYHEQSPRRVANIMRKCVA